MNSHDTYDSDILHELAATCLRHFQQEERALLRVYESALAIRDALRCQQSIDLQPLTERQEEAAAESRALRSCRDELRLQLSAVLAIGFDEATIAGLANQLPPDRGGSLLELRDRLRQLSLDIERVAVGNAVLLRSRLEMFEQLLTSLTGSDAHSQRYAPTGQREAAASRSIMQARC
ncbi:MAG: flagellar export chaperone FlgN [Pirellulaceae bacterium]|nr:flagellar export chaperone FlgN [Planctomycetales bacterium]MCA9263967.1 flagellar export chaperone FlgN [Planctomycetales bacterium]